MDLTYLNLAYNELTEIEESTFTKLNEVQILDLSGNKLKVLNQNIFKNSQSELKFLNIANNEITELINFNRYTVADVRIAGIDLNRINCTHFENLFESLNWRNFDSFSTRIKCNSNSNNVTSNAHDMNSAAN